MIKVQFVCDHCGATNSTIEEDLKTVFCLGCNEPEELDLPLKMHAHVPKIKQRAFTAIDPEGNEHEGVGINYFARKHGLDVTGISACLNNPDKRYKGWRFIDKGMLLFHTIKQRDEGYRA